MFFFAVKLLVNNWDIRKVAKLCNVAYSLKFQLFTKSGISNPKGEIVLATASAQRVDLSFLRYTLEIEMTNLAQIYFIYTFA